MSDDYLSRAEGDDPAEATSRGIAGVILAIFGGLIGLVNAFFDGVADVVGVMSDFREFIGAFFTAPIQILEETASFVAFELTRGEWAFFGPGTFAVGVMSIVLAWWVWNVLDPKIPFIDTLLPWR